MSELLARVHDVSEGDVIFWIGVLIVVGCIVAAAVAAWRALWLVCGLLILVAIVAAFLLL